MLRRFRTISVGSTVREQMLVGRLHSGANYLAGSIDEVAVYTTVMSATTVTEHYSAGL